MTDLSELLNSKRILKANTKLTDRSKTMSRNMTKAEQILWFNVLRGRQLAGYKFIKQKQVFGYIVDFYCSELLLVVECDGSSHNDRLEYDKARDNFLKSCGLRIVRINNSDIEHNLEGVHTMLGKLVGEMKK